MAAPSAAESPAAPPARRARDLAPALDRGMRVLDLLSASPQRAYTVSDIARALGLPKSSAFNLCAVLAEGQLLRRARDGFQLGRGLVQLGSAYVSSVNIVGEFYEACRALPADLRAIVQMAVLDDGFDTVYLAAQDCNSGLRLGLGGGVGRRVPANCTACGKALLALLPPSEFDQRLAAAGELPRMTRRSVGSPARLSREIAEVRRTGYAADEEETIAGLSCIAAAFPSSHADSGCVAVSISALCETLDPDRQAQIRSALDGIVRELRSRL